MPRGSGLRPVAALAHGHLACGLTWGSSRLTALCASAGLATITAVSFVTPSGEGSGGPLVVSLGPLSWKGGGASACPAPRRGDLCCAFLPLDGDSSPGGQWPLHCARALATTLHRRAHIHTRIHALFLTAAVNTDFIVHVRPLAYCSLCYLGGL